MNEEQEWFWDALLTTQTRTKPRYWFGTGLWFGTSTVALGSV